MRGIFYNVLGGAASGAILGAALYRLDGASPEDKSPLSTSIARGTSVGGIIGLIAGVIFIYSEITFAEQSSFIEASLPLRHAPLRAPFAPPLSSPLHAPLLVPGHTPFLSPPHAGWQETTHTLPGRSPPQGQNPVHRFPLWRFAF